MKRKKKSILYRGIIPTVIFIVILAVAGAANLLFAKYTENKHRISKLEVGTDMYALEEEVRNKLGPECVAISTDRSKGSGILWSYDGQELLVVTAGHMMADFESGELELWSGEKLEFSEEDVQIFSEYDAAVIQLFAQESLKQERGGAGEYVSESRPEIGENVWVINSVYGPASGINRCQVYAVDYYLDDYSAEMLLLSGDGMAGMSGCPVYDEEGRLVAMMSGMCEDGSILAAVSVENLLRNIDLQDFLRYNEPM